MIPYTALPILYALTLLAVSIFAVIRDRKLWPVVTVMVLNWIGTRAITAYEVPGIAAGLLDLSSAIILACLCRTAAMAVLPVSALFGLMVISYVAADFSLLQRETMWAFADVGAYLQLLIIAGFAVGGPGRLAHVDFRPRRVAAVARAVSRRVQD